MQAIGLGASRLAGILTGIFTCPEARSLAAEEEDTKNSRLRFDSLRKTQEGVSAAYK